jgi:hypothetical protein
MTVSGDRKDIDSSDTDMNQGTISAFVWRDCGKPGKLLDISMGIDISA